MNDHFFNGFADEMLKSAGPLDWIKRKLGMQKAKPVTPMPKPKKTVSQVVLPKKKPALTGGGQRKALKREGVFGM